VECRSRLFTTGCRFVKPITEKLILKFIPERSESTQHKYAEACDGMILRIGGITCSKPYIVVRARPLGMRTALLHGHGSRTWNTSLPAVPLCTACANAGVLYRAAVCMRLDDTSPVERAAVESAARDWAHRQYLNAMASSPDALSFQVVCAFSKRKRHSYYPPFRIDALETLAFQQFAGSPPS
jgi:hypothetical protein